MISDLGSSETAAVVQVMANTPEEAKKLATFSLENAITVLTYALCRQAMVESHGSQWGELDLHLVFSQDIEENSRVRTWRRQLQGVTEGSSDEGAGQVLVMHSTGIRSLPRLEGGNLARFVSDPATQMLWQILSRDTASKSDPVQTEYEGPIVSAATYLRRSMESEPPHDLIDAFTGLEALFTPRKTDIFYPTAATIGHGVAYTSAGRDDPSVRLATWKQVKDLYAERSRLVHGDRLSEKIPHAASAVPKMLVEGIEFCLVHESMIVGCGGIRSWLDKVRFGCPEALVTEGDPRF